MLFFKPDDRPALDSGTYIVLLAIAKKKLLETLKIKILWFFKAKEFTLHMN